ncbi:hypothetical protein SLS58_005802 [Diplodia intermedia]|uniref:Carboxylesterase type B domain-containing protein n=1 Tax=Diplodia intermedia TaxID=856260 RepID=A0ABR3TPQ5_9PEZI
MIFCRRALTAVASLVLFTPVFAAPVSDSASLPVVDLGYERYRAAEYNQAGDYFNFSNIRYATPPLGDLRFKAPVPPVTGRMGINDGSVGRICPQAPAAHSSHNSSSTTRDPRESEDCLFLDVIVPRKVFEKASHRRRDGGADAPVLVWFHGGSYMTGSKNSAGNPAGLIRRHNDNDGNDDNDGVIFVSINYRLGAFGFLSTGQIPPSPPPSANDTDAITANAALHDQRLALRWVQSHIHLFGGSRARVTAMGESAGAGAIAHHVTAYGGRGLRRDDDDSSAVYPIDRDYGGDNDGSGAVHRSGGRGKLDDHGKDGGEEGGEGGEEGAPRPPLFHRAILESPGWHPSPGPRAARRGFGAFLGHAGVGGGDDVAALRALPSERLMEANRAMVAAAPPGSFVFGPVVDGGLVRADPKAVLLRVYGGVDGGGGGGGSVGGVQAVLTGRNADEGARFVPPGLQTDAQFEAFVRAALDGGGEDDGDDAGRRGRRRMRGSGPGRGNGAAAADPVDYIVKELYPPVYNGSGALYADVRERAALLLSESLFTCNAFALNSVFAAAGRGAAKDVASYAYLFAVPPAVHGQVVPYTFYVPGQAQDAYGAKDYGTFNATVAGVLQDYVVSFAASGMPESAGDGLKAVEAYGTEARTARMGEQGFEMVTDPAANKRCLWWMQAAAQAAQAH